MVESGYLRLDLREDWPEEVTSSSNLLYSNCGFCTKCAFRKHSPSLLHLPDLHSTFHETSGLCHPPSVTPCPDHYFFCRLKIFLIEIQLIYNVLLVSDIQQSDSVIHAYIYIFFRYVLFHHRLLQDIDYSSLCYTISTCDQTCPLLLNGQALAGISHQ